MFTAMTLARFLAFCVTAGVLFILGFAVLGVFDFGRSGDRAHLVLALVALGCAWLVATYGARLAKRLRRARVP